MGLTILKDFLKKHYTPGKSLLLGLSGGGDSLALLSLLLECGVDLHIAHVDHGWREESGEEAKKLQELAHQLHLPYHTTKLQVERSEEAARLERLRFFKELFFSLHCQALLLAHHADDQSETVLKRVLEGAHLFALGGIQPVSHYEGMVIWRPLLKVRKSELKSPWQPFEDSTNRDPRYLRARTRLEILPSLSRTFGKQVSTNLLHLGDTADEINAYLEAQTQSYFSEEKWVHGPFGTLWDLSSLLPHKHLELKYALKKFFASQEITLSRSAFEQIQEHLQTEKANSKFPIKNQTLYIDRGRLFLLKKKMPAFSFSSPLEEGTLREGDWEWKISFTAGSASTPDWRDLWRGIIRFQLAQSRDYQLVPPDPQQLFPRTNAIKWWWGEHRVPAFLRGTLPLILYQGKIYYELLSGKSQYQLECNQSLVIEVVLKNRE